MSGHVMELRRKLSGVDTAIRIQENSEFASSAFEGHLIDVPARRPYALERNGLQRTHAHDGFHFRPDFLS